MFFFFKGSDSEPSQTSKMERVRKTSYLTGFWIHAWAPFVRIFWLCRKTKSWSAYKFITKDIGSYLGVLTLSAIWATGSGAGVCRGRSGQEITLFWIKLNETSENRSFYSEFVLDFETWPFEVFFKKCQFFKVFLG